MGRDCSPHCQCSKSFHSFHLQYPQWTPVAGRCRNYLLSGFCKIIVKPYETHHFGAFVDHVTAQRNFSSSSKEFGNSPVRQCGGHPVAALPRCIHKRSDKEIVIKEGGIETYSQNAPLFSWYCQKVWLYTSTGHNRGKEVKLFVPNS